MLYALSRAIEIDSRDRTRMPANLASQMAHIPEPRPTGVICVCSAHVRGLFSFVGQGGPRWAKVDRCAVLTPNVITTTKNRYDLITQRATLW